jgi:hypothetical protein
MTTSSRKPASVPGAGDILAVPTDVRGTTVRDTGAPDTAADRAQVLSKEEIKNRPGGEDVEKAAMTFVIEQGGSIADAEQAIEALRSGPAALFVRRIGSIDEALELLRRLDARISPTEDRSA